MTETEFVSSIKDMKKIEFKRVMIPRDGMSKKDLEWYGPNAITYSSEYSDYPDHGVLRFTGADGLDHHVYQYDWVVKDENGGLYEVETLDELFKNYRYEGKYGYIMIAAMNDDDDFE